MNVILWIVFGAIAGWIASLITGSNRGLLGDMVVGILGALLGGWLMALFGAQGITGFNVWSLIVAVLGSIVLIWITRLVRQDTSIQS